MIDWDREVIGPVMTEFAEPVIYYPVMLPGSSFQAHGVFDESHRLESGIGGGLDVSTSVPVIGIQDALFQRPPEQGDRLTICRTGVTYEVKDVRPDGHGHSKLMLVYVAGG